MAPAFLAIPAAGQLAMGATAIGSGISAMGTLAGGSMAAQAGQAQKEALTNEAATAFASGQRTALDTTQRTKLLQSTAMARGAASGIDAGVGSPATNQGEIAQRGSYQALMDMFNAKSRSELVALPRAARRMGGQAKAGRILPLGRRHARRRRRQHALDLRSVQIRKPLRAHVRCWLMLALLRRLAEWRRRRMWRRTGERLERLRRRALFAVDERRRVAAIDAAAAVFHKLETIGAVTGDERLQLRRRLGEGLRGRSPARGLQGERRTACGRAQFGFI